MLLHSIIRALFSVIPSIDGARSSESAVATVLLSDKENIEKVSVKTASFESIFVSRENILDTRDELLLPLACKLCWELLSFSDSSFLSVCKSDAPDKSMVLSVTRYDLLFLDGEDPPKKLSRVRDTTWPTYFSFLSGWWDLVWLLRSSNCTLEEHCFLEISSRHLSSPLVFSQGVQWKQWTNLLL